MAETDSNARVGGAARVETLAKFYLGCIEAEQAAALALRIDGNYLEAVRASSRRGRRYRSPTTRRREMVREPLAR